MYKRHAHKKIMATLFVAPHTSKEASEWTRIQIPTLKWWSNNHCWFWSVTEPLLAKPFVNSTFNGSGPSTTGSKICTEENDKPDFLWLAPCQSGRHFRPLGTIWGQSPHQCSSWETPNHDYVSFARSVLGWSTGSLVNIPDFREQRRKFLVLEA